MYSELECGICYRIYNAGRRCPRELRCKHSFCESCLLALSRAPRCADAPPGADIVCPLCRGTTSISGERRVRAELRVDESVLEQLIAAGVLEQEGGDPEEEEEEEAAASPESSAEESESFSGSRGGRLRRSWKKVWRKIRGESSQRTGAADCMTNEDMRNLAMMSCYMF